MSDRLLTARFALVTASAFAFFIYIGVTIAVVPRMIEEAFGGGAVDVGLNVAVFAAAAIAIRPALSRFSDARGLRVTMIAGGLMALAGTTALLLIENRWWMLPIRAVQGIGEAAVFVAGTSLTAGQASANRRAEAASYFSVAVFGGIGIGPIVAESLIADEASRADQFHAAIWVAAAVIGVSVVLAMLLPRDSPTGPAAHNRTADDLARRGESFATVALRPGLVLAFGMAGFSTFNAFMPTHVPEVGLGGVGKFYVVYSVVCLVVRVLGARLPERIGLQRTASGALAGVSGGLLVLGLSTSPTGVYAGTAVLALGMSFMYPALQAMTINAAADAQRMRAIATFTMFFEVGSVAGGLMFGPLAHLTSKQGGFLGGCVVAAAGIVFLWRVAIPALGGSANQVHTPDIVSAS